MDRDVMDQQMNHEKQIGGFHISTKCRSVEWECTGKSFAEEDILERNQGANWLFQKKWKAKKGATETGSV